jgi:hypothetical protein
MYIPLTFFGSQGSCITATVTSITGSGGISTGSFLSGGVYWDYYKFENTTNPNASTASFIGKLDILSGSTTQAKILVVGGGGGGGFNPGDSCINPYIDTLGSAGGGGGGGVVYYDQFSLSSGSYEISVGAGGSAAGAGRIGGNGSVSYLKNKSYEYTPFTSSFITAYGGGGGAGNTNNCISAGYGIGNSGASSGGGSQTAIAGNLVPAVGAYPYTGGNPPVIQGYGAGSITGNPFGNDRAMGGGGAATSSANITSTYNPAAGSPGGNGLFYNLAGTELGYGAGGGGVRWTNTGTGILTGNGAGWGNAGSGGTGGFGGRFSTPRGAEAGLNGTVIIAIKRCDASFYTCNISEFIGIGSGAPTYPFGASFDFIDCLTNASTTLRPHRLNPFGYCISGSLSAINIAGNSTGAFANCQACSEITTDCETKSVVCGQTSGNITYTPCGQTSSITLPIAGNTGYDVCMSGSYSYTGDITVGLSRGKCYATSSLSCQAYTPCYYRTFKAGASVATASYWQCNATASVTTYISASQSLQVSLNITKPSSITGTGASVLSYYNCTSYQFTAGPSGGTATFLYCGLGNSGSVALGANQQITVCCVTGTTALTGLGSIIGNLGACVTGSSGIALWP